MSDGEGLRSGAPGPTPEPTVTGALPPALVELRGSLEHVDDVPLDQRPALLERANQALVDALGDLEEV